MTHTSSKKESLYQRITDVCFDYVGVSKPMADDLHALFQSELTQALKELKEEEAVELPMSSGDNIHLVPIEAIDAKLKESEK